MCNVEVEFAFPFAYYVPLIAVSVNWKVLIGWDRMTRMTSGHKSNKTKKGKKNEQE